MTAAQAASVFNNPVLAIIILVAYSILFIIFTLFKSNLIAITIATAFLVILDYRFAILLIADIVLVVMSYHIEKPLKSELGYPIFSTITVRCEKFNCPNYDESGN